MRLICVKRYDLKLVLRIFSSVGSGVHRSDPVEVGQVSEIPWDVPRQGTPQSNTGKQIQLEARSEASQPSTVSPGCF